MFFSIAKCLEFHRLRGIVTNCEKINSIGMKLNEIESFCYLKKYIVYKVISTLFIKC